MTAAVVVENVSKFFRRAHQRPRRMSEAWVRFFHGSRRPEPFWALREVSFELASGKMLGIIGRNGAGKSTLLKLIGGVGRPTEGRIETRGGIRALLDLGSTFQPDLTGRENVVLHGVVAGLTRREVQQRFDDIVAFAELQHFIDDPVRTYSTGMKTRLAFAVAVHTDPEILLVDEVLAVGDLGFQNKCRERIERFKQDGCAILLVSHEMPQIEDMCDVALWLRGGRVAAYGDPKVVIDRYTNEVMEETRLRMPATKEPALATSGRELRINYTRFGSLELEIVGVFLKNQAGSPVQEVEPGDPLIIEIEYEIGTVVTSPQFSMTILREDGLVCFEATTANAGQTFPDLSGRGRLALHIERLDLAGGNYYVDVGAYEKGWTYAYDYHHRVYPLRVRGRGSLKGILAAPYRWSLEKEPSGREKVSTSEKL